MQPTLLRTLVPALLLTAAGLAGCASMEGVVDSARDASERGLYKLGLSDKSGNAAKPSSSVATGERSVAAHASSGASASADPPARICTTSSR